MAQIESLIDHIDDQLPDYLVSNCGLNFYSTYGKIIPIKNDSCKISKELAQRLQVKPGDMIQFVPF